MDAINDKIQAAITKHCSALPKNGAEQEVIINALLADVVPVVAQAASAKTHALYANTATENSRCIKALMDFLISDIAPRVDNAYLFAGKRLDDVLIQYIKQLQPHPGKAFDPANFGYEETRRNDKFIFYNRIEMPTGSDGIVATPLTLIHHVNESLWAISLDLGEHADYEGQNTPVYIGTIPSHQFAVHLFKNLGSNPATLLKIGA